MQQQLDLLLNSSVDGIFSCDLDFKITEWNKQMERFSGLSKNDCVNKCLFDLFPALKDSSYFSKLKKVIKGKFMIIKGLPFNTFIQSMIIDFYEGYYTPILDDNQNIIGILGIVREVGLRSGNSFTEKKPNIHDTVNFKASHIESDNIHFKDVFNMDDIQEIQDNLAKSFDVASIITDPEGRPITNPSNFHDLCSIIQKTPVGYKNCLETFASFSKDKDHAKWKCCSGAGLLECGIKIIVNNTHVGNWVIGQILPGDEKLSHLSEYARKISINREVYEDKLKELDQLPEQQLDQYKSFVQSVLKNISSAAAEKFNYSIKIKDHFQYEESLKRISKKHEELARIVSKSPVVAFSWNLDKDRSVNFVSENINQFGYNQQDFYEKKISYHQIIDEEDLGSLERSFLEFINNGQEESFIKDYKVKSLYGNTRWVQERSWPRKNEEGKIISWEGLIVDISVRKFAEEALLASKEHFKLFFDKAPIGMGIISDKGEILKVNKSFCGITGYSEIELVGENIAKLIQHEDLKKSVHEDELLFAGEKTNYKLEKRLVRKDGRKIYTIEQGAILQNPHNELHKLIQVVDITNRKMMENDLIESERRLNQAQTFAQMGNWEYDYLKRNYIISDEIYQIFGLRKDALAKRGTQTFTDCFFPEDKHKLKETFSGFIKGEHDEMNIEFDIKRNDDGKIRTIHSKSEKVFDENSNHFKVIGIVQDITDRKKIEEDLKVRNNELTNFVYKVSHDLRSPLLSISGLLSLVKINSNPAEKEYLDLIENRIKRLDEFISDILSHSKNLYTAVSIEKIDFDVIINECFEELSYLKNADKIIKRINISGTTFYSDRQRFKDILKNLISNSIHYLKPSKEENLVIIDIETTNDGMKLTFEDNGLGIEPKVLPRIYDMFFRGIEISNGSGIGLYIVKQAIEKLNGEIKVESSTASGTTFKISLPNLVNKINADVDMPTLLFN